MCECANPLFLSLFVNAKLCKQANEITCSNGVFDSKSFNTFSHLCFNLCPLECNKTEYRVTSTNIDVVGDLYADYINNNVNLSADFDMNQVDANTARKSFVYLFVSYESLSYELNAELANMDIVLVLSNMGGTLGLFLGISALSMCEIVEVLLEMYFVWRTDKNTNKCKSNKKKIDPVWAF